MRRKDKVEIVGHHFYHGKGTLVGFSEKGLMEYDDGRHVLEFIVEVNHGNGIVERVLIEREYLKLSD